MSDHATLRKQILDYCFNVGNAGLDATTDAVLASEWLVEHDRQVAEKALCEVTDRPPGVLMKVAVEHYAECIRKGDDPAVILSLALAQQRVVDAEIADQQGVSADRRGTYARGQRVMADRIIHAIHAQACGSSET